MSDVAAGRRSKAVRPSFDSLVRLFAPGSSAGDRGSSLFSFHTEIKPRAQSATMSFLTSTSTLAVLKDVAEIFDSIPYIKAAAGIVLWIIEIRDISELGDKWLEFIEKLNGVVTILRDLREGHKRYRSEAELPRDLKEDLYRLATQLQQIRQVLLLYTTHQASFWAKMSRVLKRAELLKQAEKCSRDLDSCLQAFVMRSLISLRLQAHRGHEVVSRPSPSKYEPLASSKLADFITDVETSASSSTHLPKIPEYLASSLNLSITGQSSPSQPYGPSNGRIFADSSLLLRDKLMPSGLSTPTYLTPEPADRPAINPEKPPPRKPLQPRTSGDEVHFHTESTTPPSVTDLLTQKSRVREELELMDYKLPVAKNRHILQALQQTERVKPVESEHLPDNRPTHTNPIAHDSLAPVYTQEMRWIPAASTRERENADALRKLAREPEVKREKPKSGLEQNSWHSWLTDPYKDRPTSPPPQSGPTTSHPTSDGTSQDFPLFGPRDAW